MTAERYHGASFSAADLERVAVEARAALVGGRLRGVRPRGRGGFCLAVRDAADARTEWLLVRLEPPPLARAHLLEGRPAEGDKVATSPFYEQVEARLAGAGVAALEAVPGDRVLRIDLAAREGGPRHRLWLALFGGRGNAALEEIEGEATEGTIVASVRPGEGRPLLTTTGSGTGTGTGTKTGRPPLFPDIEPDPVTRAYSRALEAWYEAQEAAAERDERRRALTSELERRRRKAVATCEKLRAAVAECAGADEAQRAGELLLSSLHLIRRGATEVKVPDYFVASDPPPERTIALHPELGPAEQAARYFKAAKKYRRGAAVAAERLAAFEASAARLAAGLETLAALPPGEDPDPIAAASGVRLPGGPRAPRRRAPEAPSGPRRFKSHDGLEILVGRSNEENDELTLRTAKSNDLFFHVQGFPGSHVIVRAPKGKSVPLETLLDAAALAVHYSKARDHGRAEVSYTPRKYVRKPRGAKPGLVALERSETLLLGRDDGLRRLERVLATGGRAAAGDDAEPGGAARRPMT